MLIRDYGFLKHKYRELLLPTIFMVLSDKLSVLICTVLTGYFLSSLALSACNLGNPFLYLGGVFYTLFGQGGNLLVLRSKAVNDDEKADFYFSVALFALVLINLVYLILVQFFLEDILIYIFHVPNNILPIASVYIRTAMFFLPFCSYTAFMSYFLRSDGYPNLPLVSFLLTNILNLLISYVLLAVFDMGVFGSALGSVIANVIGALCITTYFFKENRSFHIVPSVMLKMKEVLTAIKEFIINTPEIIGRLFNTFKVSFLTLLCSTYLGALGLLAYLVYDNSETVFYMLLSGIMKVVTPIVAVFYKEKDYESVYFIIDRSLKEVLIAVILFCIFIMAFPQLFIHLFSIYDPSEVSYISLVLRITSIGLVGRCVSILLTNYAEAIEENKIATLMSFSEEFLLVLISGIVLTHFLGGIGIWIAVVIADVMPILIYSRFTKIQKKKREDISERFFLLPESDNISWTYIRNDDNNLGYDLDDQTRELLGKLRKILGDKETVVTNTIRKFGKHILDNDDEINEIDVIIRKFDNEVTFTLTYEGKLLNPISDEDIKSFEKINGTLDYTQVLGFNRTFINVTI